MSPEITVLMPVYNGEKYLRESIESILNQTFNDFEYLIINDGLIVTKDMTIKKMNTRTSIDIKIPNLLSIKS